MSTTRFRTERSTMYEQIRRSLAKLGYDPLRPIFLSRWMRYRFIVVAVNHLATVLHREPYRVYQALLCRAEWTARGRPFMPNRQAQPTQEGLVESERSGGLHVYCPHCGADLLDCGRVTKPEVDHERRARAKQTGK